MAYLCVYLSVPFVSLWSDNNLIEAKRKIESEKKQKDAKKWNRIFQVNKRNTWIRIQFRFILLISEKNF